MMFTKRFTVLISILLLALGGIGCSAPTLEVPKQAFEPTIVAPTLETEEEFTEKVTGGTIYTAMPTNPTTFHPLVINDEDMRNLFSIVFEPAIRTGPDGRFYPSLIENWSVSDDGLEYSFSLRKNVFFHGSSVPMNADDIIFTMDEIKKLAPDKSDYALLKGSVKSYTMVSESEIKVIADHPGNDVLYFMNFPVLPRLYYSDMLLEENLSLPKGTGPFKADSYEPDKGLFFSVNEKWWKQTPNLATVLARPTEDEEKKVNNMHLDLINCTGTSLMTANSYRSSGKINVISSVTPYYEALVPNLADPVIDDRKLRQAISSVIDRQEIISRGLLGQGIATTTPLRPDFWVFEENLYNTTEYSIERALKLLEEAGYRRIDGMQTKDGETFLSLELLYCEAEGIYYRKTVAELLKVQFAQIGIELVLVERNYTDFSRTLREGSFQLALCGFYTMPNNDLSYIFKENGSLNYGKYLIENIVELNRNAKNASADEQKSAYIALESKLQEDLPHIGLYYKQHALLVDVNIKGISNLSYLSIFENMGEWYFTRVKQK